MKKSRIALTLLAALGLASTMVMSASAEDCMRNVKTNMIIASTPEIPAMHDASIVAMTVESDIRIIRAVDRLISDQSASEELGRYQMPRIWSIAEPSIMEYHTDWFRNAIFTKEAEDRVVASDVDWYKWAIRTPVVTYGIDGISINYAAESFNSWHMVQVGWPYIEPATPALRELRTFLADRFATQRERVVKTSGAIIAHGPFGALSIAKMPGGSAGERSHEADAPLAILPVSLNND